MHLRPLPPPTLAKLYPPIPGHRYFDAPAGWVFEPGAELGDARLAWWLAAREVLARLRAGAPAAFGATQAIGLSGQMHGAVLLVRFADPEGFNRAFKDTPLDVVLVNARSNEKPREAQAIAQANLAGGGEAAKGRAASPLPASPTMQLGDAADDARDVGDGGRLRGVGGDGDDAVAGVGHEHGRAADQDRPRVLQFSKSGAS